MSNTVVYFNSPEIMSYIKLFIITDHNAIKGIYRNRKSALNKIIRETQLYYAISSDEIKKFLSENGFYSVAGYSPGYKIHKLKVSSEFSGSLGHFVIKNDKISLTTSFLPDMQMVKIPNYYTESPSSLLKYKYSNRRGTGEFILDWLEENNTLEHDDFIAKLMEIANKYDMEHWSKKYFSKVEYPYNKIKISIPKMKGIEIKYKLYKFSSTSFTNGQLFYLIAQKLRGFACSSDTYTLRLLDKRKLNVYKVIITCFD